MASNDPKRNIHNFRNESIYCKQHEAPHTLTSHGEWETPRIVTPGSPVYHPMERSKVSYTAVEGPPCYNTVATWPMQQTVHDGVRQPVQSTNPASTNFSSGVHQYYQNHSHHQDSSMQEKGSANISCEYKHDKVFSTDPILSTDPKALGDFLRLHGLSRPKFALNIAGTHTETRYRTVSDGRGGTTTESYTVVVTDFRFSIDLSDLIVEEPQLYTLRDDVPAYRGDMTMATETGGARPVEQRTLVERSAQSAQKSAKHVERIVGRPPWLATAQNRPLDEEFNLGLIPQASSRTFEEWLEDYVHSECVIKEFKFSKEVYSWDLVSLTKSITNLIRSTSYSTSVHIAFQTSPNSVRVFSPNIVSKIFSSYLYIFLTSVIFVFPFLWMWRRWWPGAGGKWAVSGAAFRLKSWELVPGTYPGELEQGAMWRLGGPNRVGGSRLRAGKEGVWVLKGVHEADWFRVWEASIRSAVRERI